MKDVALEEIIGALLLILLLPIIYAWHVFSRNNRDAQKLRKGEREADTKAQLQVDKATREALEEKEEITGRYKVEVKKVVDEIQNKYVESQDDAKGVNDFLKDVGKKIRGRD